MLIDTQLIFFTYSSECNFMTNVITLKLFHDKYRTRIIVDIDKYNLILACLEDKKEPSHLVVKMCM